MEKREEGRVKSGEWRARVKVLDHYRKKLTKLSLRADEVKMF